MSDRPNFLATQNQAVATRSATTIAAMHDGEIQQIGVTQRKITTIRTTGWSPVA